MLLLIDNFDSFSHILADLIRQTGQELLIIRNDFPVERINEIDFDGLILSPGPGVPNQAGNLNTILSEFYNKKPILGVCLGHQAIGEFFGARLIKNKIPTHGKVHRVYQSSPHALMNQLPDNFTVTRYHSLQLDQLPESLIPLLKTKEGEIMSMAHRELPIFGIQYHPEALLSEFGLEIIQNWLKWSKIDTRIN